MLMLKPTAIVSISSRYKCFTQVLYYVGPWTLTLCNGLNPTVPKERVLASKTENTTHPSTRPSEISIYVTDRAGVKTEIG